MKIPFRFEKFMEFQSRRSPVVSTHGIVAASEPLAVSCGIQVLLKGGNAADAAVATAAGLNVTEPMSTGIGGDCFSLFFDAQTKRVRGVNGSGRAPRELTLEIVRQSGIKGTEIPTKSPHAVTVPGAVAGWLDTVERHGNLSIADVLAPAIRLAEEGFPVSPLIAFAWSTGVGKLKAGSHGADLLLKGRAPEPGEIFRNPNLAKIFRTVAEHGKAGFYEDWPADQIVKILQERGGVMTQEDLKTHRSTFDKPISTRYRGVDVYEIPPNGQGITALIALNLLEGFDIPELDPTGPEYFHLLIEAMRLAFADSRWFVADPSVVSVPIEGLLSKNYARERRELIQRDIAAIDQQHGTPTNGSDTVYLSVVDGEGNACSFINSNYAAFGTGLVPEGTGFVLQNRGCNFSLNPDHPNVVAPGKRPYHTIIPAMATRDGNLFASFGVMGGFMQPQGHVQVLSKLVDHEYDPQAALDAPRFCILSGEANGVVALEDGIPASTRDQLTNMGHDVRHTVGWARSVFGRGQVICRDPDTGVLWAGSDPRSDGCAFGL